MNSICCDFLFPYSVKHYKITAIKTLVLFFLLLSGNLQILAQETKKISYSADDVHQSLIRGGITRLIGNTGFEHENMVLKCDSAHLDEKNNSFFGYGNVYLNQGDTIEAFGDKYFMTVILRSPNSGTM